MKIVCDSCGAKYSIADEKVQGKVFKIRCKKCGDSIVVRGETSPEPEPAAAPSLPFGGEEEDGDAETRVFDYSGYQGSGDGDAAVWHIVVDGNQQGPYTTAQIREFLSAGSLDADGYVWREGFDDWLPIKDVPEIHQDGQAASPADPNAGLFGGGAQTPEPAPSPAPAIGGGGLFDAPQDDGGLFGGEPAPAASQATGSPFESSGGLFGSEAAPSADAGGGDIFSSAPSAAAPTDGLFGGSDPAVAPPTGGLFSGDAGGGQEVDLFGAEPPGGAAGGNSLFDDQAQPQSPRVSAEQAMTGQRNENSVLFSLSNLQALASGPASAGSDFAGGGPAPIVTNTGGSEGSGLIDIRSLASSLSAAENDAKTSTEVDDLISLGGGGFGPGLGAPVLAAHNEGMSMGAKIGIGAAVLTFLAAVVVVAVMLMQKDDNPQDAEIAILREQIEKLKQQGSGGGAAAAGVSPKIEELQKQLIAAEEKKRQAGEQAPEEDDGDEGDEDESEAKKPSSTRRSSSTKASSSSSTSKSSRSSSSSSAASSPDPSSSSRSSSSSPKKSGSSELDDLLGGTGSSKKKAAPAAAPKQAAASGGKTSLDRSDVQKGMNSVAGSVKQCGQGQSGTVTLKVVIANTGRVVSASPTGQFAGTSVGACAARAVRSARFPKFSGSNLTVRYPFKI